jgi:hypothetical protein
MGHHFNHNPSLSMKHSTVNSFANRLGQKKGKFKDQRIQELTNKFFHYYINHSGKHINRMIVLLRNNNNMTFEEASIIATNEIGI